MTGARIRLALAAALGAAAAGCTTTIKESTPFTANVAQERALPEKPEPAERKPADASSARGDRGDGRPAAPADAPPGKHDPQIENDLELLVEIDGLLQKWVTALNLADDGEREAAAGKLRPLADAHHQRLLRFVAGTALEARIVASGALGFSTRPDALPILLESLRDANPYVRSNSALSLGLIGNKELPKEPFLNLLTDPESAVRGSAAFALSRLVRRGVDSAAVPVLIDALKDKHFAVRNESVRALAVLGDRRATRPLLESTFSDPYFLIRLNTAVALARLQDPRAIGPLIEAISDPDENIRKAARWSLSEITRAGVEDTDAAWRAWWAANREQVAKDILEGRGTSGTSEVDLGPGR